VAVEGNVGVDVDVDVGVDVGGEENSHRHNHNHNHNFTNDDDDRGGAFGKVLRSLKELTKSPPPGSIKCWSPHLTPIYDKVVYRYDPGEPVDRQRKRKIPPIIHISFNDRCVPNELAESIKRWQEALPEFSLFFHDDDAVQRLIDGPGDCKNNDVHYQNHNRNRDCSNRSSSSFQQFSSTWQSSGYFPKLRNHMRCIKFKGAMLIDVWRMLIIYEFGGKQ